MVMCGSLFSSLSACALHIYHINSSTLCAVTILSSRWEAMLKMCIQTIPARVLAAKRFLVGRHMACDCISTDSGVFEMLWNRFQILGGVEQNGELVMYNGSRDL